MNLKEYLTERPRLGRKDYDLETTKMIPTHWVANSGVMVSLERLEDVYGFAAWEVEQAMKQSEMILYKLTYGHLIDKGGSK